MHLGNVYITKVTTASSSSPKKESRTTYLTFKPTQEEKYQPASYPDTEMPQKNTNAKYTYKTVDTYKPTTPKYSPKYNKPEPSYQTSSQPSYSTTRKPVVVTLSQSYSSEPIKSYNKYEDTYEPEQSYVGVKVKSLPKPLYGKIEPYEPEKEYETYSSSYGKEPNSYLEDYKKPAVQKYGFSYVGDEEHKEGIKHSYNVEKPKYVEVERPRYVKVEKPKYVEVSTHSNTYEYEPEASYIKSEESSYERRPIYQPKRPKYTSGYEEITSGYHKPSVEYHEHNLPAEIDIGHGYKLKLVYKPKKNKSYHTQYKVSPKPSNVYVSSHGSSYPEESHQPTNETSNDYSNHKQYEHEDKYHNEVKYHETPIYYPKPEKSTYDSHTQYKPKNEYSQSSHFDKFQSNHFKQYSYKDAPRKYTFEFLKPGETLNLSDSLESSSRNNGDARDGRVLEPEEDTTIAEVEETTTLSQDRNSVDESTITTDILAKDDMISTTTESLPATVMTPDRRTTVSDELDTSTPIEDLMTTTSPVELQPRTQSEVDTTTEEEVKITTETITSTRREDFTTTDVNIDEPSTDLPRFKRKSYGYSWYLEG